MVLKLRASIIATVVRSSRDLLTPRDAASPPIGVREKPIVELLCILAQPIFFILVPVLSVSAVHNIEKFKFDFDSTPYMAGCSFLLDPSSVGLV